MPSGLEEQWGGRRAWISSCSCVSVANAFSLMNWRFSTANLTDSDYKLLSPCLANCVTTSQYWGRSLSSCSTAKIILHSTARSWSSGGRRSIRTTSHTLLFTLQQWEGGDWRCGDFLCEDVSRWFLYVCHAKSMWQAHGVHTSSVK